MTLGEFLYMSIGLEHIKRLVGDTGLEPVRRLLQQILSLNRLPVTTIPHMVAGMGLEPTRHYFSQQILSLHSVPFEYPAILIER